MGDAEIEPVTPAPEVWRAANEPPHLNLKLLSSTNHPVLETVINT